MSKLLIDERPLTVLPSLVKVVGMERAVILQQIHWLLQSPNNGIEYDGERWVWGTYEEWCADYFTFWEPDTLRKHLVKLEKDGFVFSVQIKGFDRTKHYRINTDKIKEIENPMRHDHATSKRKKFHSPNRHDHAASNRDDHATSKREDDATSKRDDHAGSYITETSTENTKTSTEIDEEERADPVSAAWCAEYGEAIPEKIQTKITGLVDECGTDAVIHGIRASVEAKSRNFGYIAKCARNYIPAPTNGNGRYHVDLGPPPAPVARPLAQPNLLPGDPWAELVADLCRTQPADWPARDWLNSSRLLAMGDVAGVPLYRVEVADADAVGWLNNRLAIQLRRSLSVLLKKPVLIEIVAAQPHLQEEL